MMILFENQGWEKSRSHVLIIWQFIKSHMNFNFFFILGYQIVTFNSTLFIFMLCKNIILYIKYINELFQFEINKY